MDQLAVEQIEAALDYVFYAGDLGEETTLRDYLPSLLIALTKEGESFSGKRPFGNSGWEYNFPVPLIGSGAISGTIKENQYDTFVEYEAVDYRESDVIKALEQIISYAFTKAK